MGYSVESEIAKLKEFIQKDRLVGIMGEANNQLRVLNGMVSRAVNIVESILVIMDFLGKSGLDLKMLLEVAAQQKDNPAEPVDSGFNPEMIYEMMRSPQFAQMVYQMINSLKHREETAGEEKEQQPAISPGPFWGPRWGFGPWGGMPPWGFARQQMGKPVVRF